jgi:4-hydroxy-tetrahydrodipicolinate synthase
MKPQGVITAMVTPFDGAYNINVPATHQLIDYLLERGVDGLFILGTNGEFFSLNDEEKVAFAKAVVDYVKGRVPVYVGAGSCGTRETIELAKRYEGVGADAISVITPYFLPLKQEELIGHYRTIAAEVSIPMVLYNMPRNTGVNIDPATLQALLSCDNIVGIKDSSGNMENLKGYLEVAKGRELAVLVGSDSKILEAMKLGAAGTVAATSNVITETIVSIVKHYREGELELAQKDQADVDVLRKVLPLGTVPAALKQLLRGMGIPVGAPRPPILPLDEAHSGALAEVLRYFGKIN